MKKKLLVIVCCLLCLFTFYKSFQIILNEHESKNNYISISYKDIENKISNDNYCIVYFYQLECSACSIFKPVLNKVIESEKYNIYGLDINEIDIEDASQKYNIEFTPTLIIFKEGKEQKRMEGYENEKKLREFLFEFDKQ